MYQDRAPSDSALLMESLVRVWGRQEAKVGSVVTDRGFASRENSSSLEESATEDMTCPRNPKELEERLKDPKFVKMQRRRGQTEARIAILKNGFLGETSRAKGYQNRRLNLSWAVLTHNLWKMAQMRQNKRKQEESQSYAA